MSTNFDQLMKNIGNIAGFKGIFSSLGEGDKKAALQEATGKGFSLLHLALDSKVAELVEFILQQAFENNELPKVLTAQDTVSVRTAFHLALDVEADSEEEKAQVTASLKSLVAYMFEDEETLKQVLNAENKYKQKLINKIVADDRLDVAKLLTNQAKATDWSMTETITIGNLCGSSAVIKSCKGIRTEGRIKKTVAGEALNKFLNFKDATGKTALLISAAKGKLELVKHFVGEIATLPAEMQVDSLLAQDNQGNSALHWAVYANNPQIATDLMTAARDVDLLNTINAPSTLEAMLSSKDRDGNTPLSLALSTEGGEMVEQAILGKVLKTSGFFKILTIQNGSDQSSLELIAMKGNIKVMQDIIEKAAETTGLVKQIIDFTNSDGKNIFVLASEAEEVDEEALQKLEEYASQVISWEAEKAEKKLAEEAKMQAEQAKLDKEKEAISTLLNGKDISEYANAVWDAFHHKEIDSKMHALKVLIENLKTNKISDEVKTTLNKHIEKLAADKMSKDGMKALKNLINKLEVNKTYNESKTASNKKDSNKLGSEEIIAKAKTTLKALIENPETAEISNEVKTALVAIVLDDLQLFIKQTPGLSDKEKEVCLNPEAQRGADYCRMGAVGDAKYKSDNILEVWFPKFSDGSGNKFLLANAKDELAAAVETAQKACTDESALYSCMDHIIQQRICMENSPYEASNAYKVLCAEGFSVEGLIRQITTVEVTTDGAMI